MEMEPDFLDRYQRQLMLHEVGFNGQRALRAARILVVGAGGLGCPVIQYLVAAGIGTLYLVDADWVSLSNLHRQTLFGTDDIGALKVEVAKRRIQLQNPEIVVSSHPEMLTTNNVSAFIKCVDLVVDCTDNFEARYLINDACALENKPWVYGSITKFEGQVSIFNVEAEDGVRSVNYRDVFPEPPKAGEIQNCEEAGVLGALAGIIGSLQAMEVLKWVLKLDGLLVNQLLCYDALQHRCTKFQLGHNSDSK